MNQDATGQEDWSAVAPSVDIDEDATLQVSVAGQRLCLYNLGGDIYATDDECTHGKASLAEGLIVDGGQIECSLHEGRFDIRTGKAVAPPCKRDLRCHAVRVQDGMVYVQLVRQLEQGAA